MLVLLLLGCGGLLDEVLAPSPLGELTGDAQIWYAPVTEAPAPPPQGLRGELPVRLEALPRADRRTVLGRICQGADTALLDALHTRLAAEEGLANPWTLAVLDGCTSPGPASCAWVDGRLREHGGDPSYADFTIWHWAGGCMDPGIWDWMPREGGSLYGTVDFLATQDNQFRPVKEEVVPVLLESLLDQDDVHRASALQALGAMDHPDSARLILRQTLRDPGAAIWLYRQSDPRARTAFESACAQWPNAWQCGEGLDPLSDLNATISADNTDLSELIDRFPNHRTAIIDGLARCVADGIRGQNNRGGRCLRALAGSGEVERANALIASPSGWVDPMWTSRRKAWIEQGDHEGIGRHLKELELIPEDFEVLDAREPPVWVADWFVDAERGVVAGNLTHTDALRRLLARSPGLEDVVVGGRSWSEALVTGPEAADELFAWMDGRRFRAVAASGGGDLVRVAGFANALAKERDLDLRFLVVDPGDLVILGPEKSLRKLVDAGYLDVAPKVAMYSEGDPVEGE